MQPIFWCVVVGISLVGELRRTTPGGLRRFHDLDPERARAVVEVYRSRAVPRMFGVWSATNATYGVIAVVQRDLATAGTAAAAGALSLAVLVLHRRNRPIVLREAELREIAEPFEITPRETSARRRRRQRQFGAAALGGLAAFPVLLGVGELTGSSLAVIASLGLLGVALLAALGYGWATAWVYGDEQPATPA